MTNASYDLRRRRFKWLNSFYDFIPQVYIQRYVCYSAAHQINKQMVKRGNCWRHHSATFVMDLASSFLLPPLLPKLALTTDSRGFLDKLLNFPARPLQPLPPIKGSACKFFQWGQSEISQGGREGCKMLLTAAQTGSHIGGSWDHDNPFHSRSPEKGDHWSYCQWHLWILPLAIFFLTNPGYGELFLR